MTIKVLESRVDEVPAFLGTRPIGTSKLSSKVESDAVRHRTKPNPLTPTSFIFRSTQWNADSVTANGRTGAISFVYSLDHIDRKNSTGDFALLKARAKMAGSEYNFGESLVEFGETVGLLNGTLSKLTRAFSSVLEGKFGKAASILGSSSRDLSHLGSIPRSKRLANGYLELSFGWLPLISDLHSAVTAYSEGLISKGDHLTKRSGSRQGNLSSMRSFDSPMEISGIASVSGTVSSNGYGAAVLNSLGLLNPALMAWNKLPFSFLIDWFVPISTVLGALTASAGLSNFQQTKTDVFLSEGIYGPGLVGHRQFEAHRTPVVGLPSIISFDKGPAFSLGQAFTAIALLRSLT